MFKRYLVAGCFVTAAVSTLFLSSRIDAQRNLPRPSAAGFTATAQPIFVAAFGVSAPVRTLPAGNGPANDVELRTEGHEINEKNTERVRPFMDGAFPDATTKSGPKTKSTVSDIWTHPAPLASLPSTSAPTLGITFEGIAVQNSAPPDTNADVGPNDIVETVNTLVQVFDKSGNPRGPAFKQSSLYQKIGGVCATTDDGDPVVLYDRLANRWIITQFGFTNSTVPPYHECIAVSMTPDPTGSYYAYDLQLPGNEFPDYPKFGVWPNGYYMTTNQFLNGGAFDGAGAFVFNRAKFLVGDFSGVVGAYFNLDLASHPEGIFGMLPSDHDGIQPPVDIPNVFAYFTNTAFGDPGDGLRLFDFAADFNTTTFSFTERAESTYASPLPLAAFDARIPNGRAHVEQPPPAGNNSTDNLDSVGERMMTRLQYTNHDGTETLVSNFTVNVSGVAPVSAATFQASFRYFELIKFSAGGLYAVNRDETYDFFGDAGNGASGDNYWMGSAAEDNSGDLAIGFSVSGVTAGHFPSLAIADLNFFDGGVSSSQLLFLGSGVQRGTSNRWGDYSSLSVDPSDDCTFWHANEYYTSTNLTFNWQTRIGNFRMPFCSSPAQGTLSGIITACDSGAPISLAFVQVSNGYSTTTIGDGTYSVQLAPGDYTVTVTDPNRHCNSAGAFNVTINDGQTTTLNACLSGIANPIVDPSDKTLEIVTGGNGNGFIDKDECNMLTVIAKNFGCAPARNVTAVLSTSTPGVTITQPNSTYDNMAIDASGANNTPFKVSTSPAFACGTPIQFTLTINFTGGSTSNSFSLPTCNETKAPVNFSGSLAAGDSSQTGRLGRDGIVGSCAGKPCPGPLTATPHLYDTFSFVNGPVASCVTVSIANNTNAATNPILAKAYVTAYDPTNFCLNYIGDTGGSPTVTGTAISFQATVPANATLVVVVEESGNGSTVAPFTAPTNYSGTVSGLSAAPIDGGGICKFTPTLSTQASPTTHAGGDLSDTATISGGLNPTGTIMFRLYGPNQSNCGGAVVFTSTVTVNGDGNYTSDDYTVPVGKEGTYRWIASYSGDASNTAVSGACNDAHESTIVKPAGTSVSGQGTISFNGCTDTFDINVFPGKKGKPSGALDFFSPCDGVLLTQVKVTGIFISGDFAEITGTAKLGKKTKVSFVVEVEDLGAPGVDFYEISLSNGYFAFGDITSGDISIH